MFNWPCSVVALSSVATSVISAPQPSTPTSSVAPLPPHTFWYEICGSGTLTVAHYIFLFTVIGQLQISVTHRNCRFTNRLIIDVLSYFVCNGWKETKKRNKLGDALLKEKKLVCLNYLYYNYATSDLNVDFKIWNVIFTLDNWIIYELY